MRWSLLASIIAISSALYGQNSQQRRIEQPTNLEEFLTNKPANSPTSFRGEDYRIGPNDLIEVTVFDAPDLGGSARVAASGLLSLPLIGVTDASGKTIQELERIIEGKLRQSYMKDPHVLALVREYASQPVSVLGSVRVPGTYQIKGQKFLLDMLAQAQGLDASAGKTIQIIRWIDAASGSPETISIDAEDLLQNGKNELNIPVRAGDTINVLRAPSIFVVGEVMQPGEFSVTQGKNFTAAIAIALGRGFTREAKKGECKIIRMHADQTKEEIPVNIGKIFDGSLADVPLLPNDILFVPANKVKTSLMKTLDTTIAVVSGRLIYRF